MTIVIGMIEKDFSMVAVDTRLSDVNSEGELVSYTDNGFKLKDIGIGWLSSVGASDICEEFANMINEKMVTNIDEIPVIFNEVDRKVRQKYQGNFDNNFNETMSLFSYSYMENDLVKFHIETINPILGRAGIVGHNKLLVLGPRQSHENEELIKKFYPLIEGANNLNELVYHTSNYIEEVSKIDEKISDICEFGFMFNMKNVLVTRKYLRGKAKDIKEACLNGNMEEQLQERTPIIWNFGI